MTQTTKKNDDIDIMRLLGLVFERKWILIISIVLCGLFAFTYGFFSKRIYQADSLIQIEKKASGMVGLEDVTEVLGDESSVSTEIQLIRSRMVLGKVVDDLKMDLRVYPEYFPFIGRKLSSMGINNPPLGLFKSMVWGNDSVKLHQMVVGPKWDDTDIPLVTLGNQEYQVTMNEKIYKGKANEVLEIPEEGTKIHIKEISDRPGVEFFLRKLNRYNLINTLGSQIQIEQKGRNTGIIKLSLAGTSKRKIKQVLDHLTTEYFSQNVQRMSAEAEKSLKFLRENLPIVENKVKEGQKKLSDFQVSNGSVNLDVETRGVLEQMILLERQLNDSKLRENDIKTKYAEEHPVYKTLKNNRKELLKKKNALSGSLKALPISQKTYLELKRDLEVNQQIYIQLLNRIQELEIVKAGTIGNVRVIDNAEINPTPIKPRYKVMTVVGVVLGFALGIVIITLINFLIVGVENPEQIENIGINVYASIPFSEYQNDLDIREKKKFKRTNDSILSEVNPTDISIEALRNFRTSIHFAMMEAKNNIIMISGPSPGVGKSFISVNLASICASSDQKVLLIDSDLRKGYLQRYFKDDKGKGLSDYIAKDIAIDEIIFETRIKNLKFIERGQVPPNPSELLMNKKFQELLNWASENFDLVILDTPPILAVTDAAIIGKYVGASFIITHFRKNSVKELQATVDRFSSAGVKINGAVMNGIQRKTGGYGYNYGYNYGYYNYEYKSDSET